MKKIFTLVAMAMLAVGANAQMITFTVDGEAAPLQDEYANGDFKLTRVDGNGKHAIDANNAYFGTAAEGDQQKFTHRLKAGGKSGSKNMLTLTVPEDGTVKICVRTSSSSATDRNLILTQNGTELFNQVIQESDAVKVKGMDSSNPDKETNVYPIVAVPVSAGQVEVTYPTNSLNFYAFEFVGGTEGIGKLSANQKEAAAIYNLAGQQVSGSAKGVVVKNGKKMVTK